MSEDNEPYVTESRPAAIDKLATALSKAQADLKNPPKNKTAKIYPKDPGKRAYTYSYADLADILDSVRETLSKNGLAVTQIVTRLGGGNVLLTRLLHSSGQYVESVYPLPSGCGAQEMGSAITYARRYSICPLLGIAGETDDDAHQAQEGAESAEEENQRLALERLDAAKAQGRVKSAYDGRTLKPGEVPEAGPGVSASASAGPTADKSTSTGPAADTAQGKGESGPASSTPTSAGTTADKPIDPRLEKMLKRDGITIEQLKEFLVRGKFIPPDMDMGKLEENFILACLNPGNWKKVVASASAGPTADKSTTGVKRNANAAKEGAK